MKDKTNVLNTYTDYAWKAACLIGGGGFVTRGSSMLWTPTYCRIKQGRAESETWVNEKINGKD